MSMKFKKSINRPKRFNQLYDKHVKYLHLQGLSHNTIDAYSRTIRRMGEYFNYDVIP